MNPSEEHNDPSTPRDNANSDPARSVQDEAMEQWGPESEAQDDMDSDAADQEVQQLRSELDEANRRLLMAHAETENLRKRMRRDYEDQLKYAAMPLIRDILDGLDNLHRAMSAAKSSEPSSGLAEGVAIVAKQLEEALRKHHCHRIPAEGELFDPNYHEAISQVPSAEHPAGVVAHEAVTGYQLHDRVVRPSQVIVSTGPAEGGQQASGQ